MWFPLKIKKIYKFDWFDNIGVYDIIGYVYQVKHPQDLSVPLLFYHMSVKLVRIIVRLADVRAGIANPADVVPAFGTMDEGTSGCRASTELWTSLRLCFAADEALVTCPGEDHQPTAERRPAHPQRDPWIHVVLQSTSPDQSFDSGSHEPWCRKRNQVRRVFTEILVDFDIKLHFDSSSRFEVLAPFVKCSILIT